MADSFHDFLEELFAPLDGVSLKRMFGGVGVFKDGVMFGLVADDALYLKVDTTNQLRFEAEDSAPFVYNNKGKSMTMSYWRLPDRLYDEAEDFNIWAGEAFAVAVRGKTSGKSVGKRRKR
ncbi:MAG: TfoX/Sxy family protein [Alphaproteobacteria bacterium]